MTMEEKMKKAALTTIVRQTLRFPMKNAARAARNLAEFADCLAGGMNPERRENLRAQVETRLLKGLSETEEGIQQIIRMLEQFLGLG